MCHVIAVSGSSGSGKSTLVNQLSKQLNVAALYFDAYQATTRYPTDMMSRLSEGEAIDLSDCGYMQYRQRGHTDTST